MVLKILSFSFAGTTGVLGSFSPLIHIGVTKPNWKTRWHKRLNFSDKVFECEEGGKNYSIYVDLNDGSGNNDTPELSFRVEKTIISPPSQKIIWSKGSDNSQSGLVAWKFRYENKNDLVFLQQETVGGFSYAVNNCKNKKISPVTSDAFGYGRFAESSEISLSQSDTCQHSLGRVECDVIISPSNKLQWSSDFKPTPKVIYTAF